MSCVVRHEPTVLGVDGGQGFGLHLRPKDSHRGPPSGPHSLLLSGKVLQSVCGDDRVTLSQILAGFGYKSGVARHKVFLWVVIWHVEW